MTALPHTSLLQGLGHLGHCVIVQFAVVVPPVVVSATEH
jgi:hypothetical protein